LGATHQAIEDVAVASSLPNMTVIAPCDPAETEAITRNLALHNQHPAYLRLAKAGEPDLTADAVEPFIFGKVRLLRIGKKTCFFAYGPTPVKMALTLSQRIAERDGAPAAVCSVHCLKPLDTDGIAVRLKNFDRIVVLEEHVPHGGLGSRIKELAWDIGADCSLHHFSLQDKFLHAYGDHGDILAAHGFDLATVGRALGL
jgi:transketolase